MIIIRMLHDSTYPNPSSLRCTIFNYPITPILRYSNTPIFFHGLSLSKDSIKALMDLSRQVVDFSVP